jgi:hypothetical protein
MVNEDVPPLMPDGVLGKPRLRLSFVEGHFVASVEEDSDVVRYVITPLCDSAGAFVILDHLKARRKPPNTSAGTSSRRTYILAHRG